MNPANDETLVSSHAPFCWIYGRISKDDRTQAQRASDSKFACASLDLQEQRCVAYAEGRGYQVQSVITDADISGSTHIADRPGGAQLLAQLTIAKSMDIERHLVVLKLDRLGRNAMDIWKLVETLDALGVNLHIVDFGGDAMSTKSAIGRLLLKLLSVLAEFELEMITDRIKAGVDSKFEAGELAGELPYGWDAVTTGQFVVKSRSKKEIKKLVENAVEQTIIQEMLKLRSMKLGYGRIAAHLNVCGIRKKKSDGKWTAGNVHRILNSRHVRERYSTAAPATIQSAAATAVAAV